jgi:hypothetical protein
MLLNPLERAEPVYNPPPKYMRGVRSTKRVAARP